MKKFTIWNEDIDIGEWKECIKEEEIATERKMSDEEKYDFVRWINEMDYKDTYEILDIQLENPILIIADNGLWDGRRTGYKVIESGNIKDILVSQMDGICRWYCNGEDICGEEAHHDGTNHYIYREILSGTSTDEALDAVLCYGKDYSLFTKSIMPYVAEAFGITA